MDTFTVILSSDPERGGYVAICPAMMGAAAEGETREETLQALTMVMEAWLDLAARDGYSAEKETPGLVAGAAAEVLEDRDAEGWDRAIELVALAPHMPVAV